MLQWSRNGTRVSLLFNGLLLLCSSSLAVARYGGPVDTHNTPCKKHNGSHDQITIEPISMQGAGISQSLPTTPGGTSPHWANGQLKIGNPAQIYQYKGSGVVRLDAPTTTPYVFEFSSAQPFVFSTKEGDLACQYGRADLDAKEPGIVTLHPAPTAANPNLVYAVFVAEFNPVIEECTGRFACVTAGSFVITATTDTFDITHPFNVGYRWDGSGTLEFSCKECESDDNSVPWSTKGVGVYQPATGKYCGTGTGTPLGNHSLFGEIMTYQMNDPLTFVFYSTTPQRTIAANGDEIDFSSYGTVVVSPVPGKDGYYVAKWTGSFYVVGGTGRFKDARPAEQPLTVIAINEPFTFADPAWKFSWTLTGQIVLNPKP